MSKDPLALLIGSLPPEQAAKFTDAQRRREQAEATQAAALAVLGGVGAPEVTLPTVAQARRAIRDADVAHNEWVKLLLEVFDRLEGAFSKEDIAIGREMIAKERVNYRVRFVADWNRLDALEKSLKRLDATLKKPRGSA